MLHDCCFVLRVSLPRFLFKTNLDAPKYRVVAADFGEAAAAVALAAAAAAAASSLPPPLPPFSTVIPEEDSVLVWATVVSQTQLLTCHLRHVTHSLSLRQLLGDLAAVPLAETAALVSSPVEVELPGPGTIAGFSGRRDNAEAFLKFVSFLDPGQILRISFPSSDAPIVAVSAPDIAVPFPPGTSTSDALPRPAYAARLSSWLRTRLEGFDASQFTSERTFVPSTDGTAQLPIFIVRRRKAAGSDERQSPQPTLLYGYGGFNVNLGPSFSVRCS
jgi:prolyl oligopeptidase